MAEPEIKYLGDVQRLVLRDGDRLVCNVDAPISMETSNRLKEFIERQLPGVQVLVLTKGIKVGVLAKDD